MIKNEIIVLCCSMLKGMLDKAKTNTPFVLISKCQLHRKYDCKIEIIS